VKAAAPAKGRTIGVKGVSAVVTGSVCIRSVDANANPDSRFDVDGGFVAAFRAAHVKKVGHSRYPFCDGDEKTRSRRQWRGRGSG
jgi:hypothetical protein